MKFWRSLLPLALVCSVSSIGADVLAQTADETSIELVDPNVLRVCADPRNLPFSNEAGQGFENKIAELLAQKLGKSLAYEYYPGATGFLRNTLNAHRCDVVMGMPQGDDSVQGTNPYYRTTYALVSKAGAGLEAIDSLEDQRLQTKKIGIVAGTPPATNLAINGLLGNLKSYPLVVDTRFDAPTRSMIEDLQEDRIDVAILWGPIAGYFAKQSKTPLKVTPLIKETTGPRMIYRIGMGVRHSDQEWKRLLNKMIADNQAEITRILIDYGVPLLDENNGSVTH
ncbi:quinoprotein dehydrogenase-associated putative ABC transporter substrate-binding protein [Beijerinckiaceae bacterium]|nr:quinoprotein dehydrogenase-associated putative ABC transporter substrate-binding protein [Beijerinckiaceae bacterium]